MTPAPDLLHARPRPALPAGPELRQALTFAFTTGGPQAAFDHLAPGHDDDPSWNEGCFAEQLLLRDFVERLLPLPRDVGRVPHRPARTSLLVAVLARPPRDPASLRQRQRIALELSRSPDVRASAIAAYRKIAEWRGLLEASGSSQRFDPLRRRIEILYATEALVNELATGLRGASSELRRVATWAESVRSSPPFRTLTQLLADETSLATVDVSLRLGRDGELRRYQLVRVDEPRGNPFHVSPWLRLWSRLVLLVLGHRIRTDEVASRLVDTAFEALEPELCRVFDLARDLDLFLGALSLCDRALAAGLPVCLPELERGGAAQLSISRLYNPFLLFEDRPPVPCDLSLTEAERIVIVTGPNSGGKTRLLEAIGLTQTLAHAGLWVPAERASLPFARGLFASLFQPRDVSSREGSLGTELLRIKSIFERIDVGGLVVVDELCSGTNPSEGEEIFEVVVELLAALRARAFITSHFLHFVARLAREAPRPGLGFRQVELDANERPTYQFTPGVAKTSLAGRTAARLGVTREELSAVVAAKLARAERAEPAAPGGEPGEGSPPSDAERAGALEPSPGRDLDAEAGSS